MMLRDQQFVCHELAIRVSAVICSLFGCVAVSPSPPETSSFVYLLGPTSTPQVTSTHLISSRSGEGVAAVASKIARERKGRDVFVVGAANVGKSAFVRALLKEMSR